MALILKNAEVSLDEEIPDKIKEKASRLYLLVHSDYLSEPYEIEDGEEILGKIIKVARESENFEYFKDKQIKFIFYKAGIFDYLYISKENWEDFRDFGLINNFNISVSLYALVKRDDKYIQIYPKRDLIYEE